jgi:hypothetical protein
MVVPEALKMGRGLDKARQPVKSNWELTPHRLGGLFLVLIMIAPLRIVNRAPINVGTLSVIDAGKGSSIRR